MYIATRWNPIYWNTACLVVNSGSLEDNSEETIVDIYEPESQEMAEGTTYEDLPDKSGKIKRTSSTDYSKVAKALGDILARGIRVSLVDINKSSYSFEPDAESNEILFGMKALSNVGESVIEQIIGGRPYRNFKEFLIKCPLNKSAMISLIKAGAFDKLEVEWARSLGVEPRQLIMTYYLSQACEPKKRITLQNFNGLIQRDLIPPELDFQKRVFNFNKYLKNYKKVGKYYVLNDQPSETFYNQFFDLENLEVINGLTCILQTKWDNIYQKQMDIARDWIRDNQSEILKAMNTSLFQEAWDKYAQGTISAWEMEALCFYYHEHELKHMNRNKYGIVDFNNLNPDPDIDYFFNRNGKQIPIYKTYKIAGTVISKNDTRSSITLLTTTGVVTVKFTKEYFAMFNRQVSERQEDGTKKIVEKGWFNRGTKVLCTGFRRDDMFVTKTYKHTPTHQLYKITEIDNEGNVVLTHEREGANNEDYN